jgi:hypothetical protein
MEAAASLPRKYILEMAFLSPPESIMKKRIEKLKLK